MKNASNPDFLYRGNDIIKLWEQYLKNGRDNNGENIQFHTGTLSNEGHHFIGIIHVRRHNRRHKSCRIMGLKPSRLVSY